MTLVKLYGGPADGKIIDVHPDLTTIAVSPQPKPHAVLPPNVSQEFRAHAPVYHYKRDSNYPDRAEYLMDFVR